MAARIHPAALPFERFPNRSREDSGAEEPTTNPTQELKALLSDTLTKNAEIAPNKKSSVLEDVTRTMEFCCQPARHLRYLNVPGRISSNFPLDLGPRPALISRETAQDFLTNKVFIVPDSGSEQVIVEYKEFSAGFVQRRPEDFAPIVKRGIPVEEAVSTIKTAETLLDPLRGTVARSELVLTLLLTAGLGLVGLVGVLLGVYVSYFIMIGVFGGYAIGLGMYGLHLGRRNSRLLTYAHLALALFARSENNRVYLARRVHLRPGYLAKWLEFNIDETSEAAQEQE